MLPVISCYLKPPDGSMDISWTKTNLLIRVCMKCNPSVSRGKYALIYGWPFLSMPRTLTANSKFEVDDFHFDLIYFENLERRIKCNLIFLYMFTILRSKFRRVVEMKPPTRLHQIFEVDKIEMKPPTSKFEVAVRVRGIDRNGQPY